MYKHFSAEFFAGNRQRLRQLFTGKAPIVLTANGLLQRNSDVTFPFRQDSNFWYLTGIDQPDIVLVIDKDKEYLIVPERGSAKEVFDGSVDFGQLSAVSGIKTVYSDQEGWQTLNKRLKKSKHVATLAAPANYIDTWEFYTNPTKSLLIEKIKAANQQITILDLRTQLARLRVIKQSCELEAIKAAIDITNKAIKRVQRRQYEHEYQIEADISADFRKNGAAGHGFTPIVASGGNACVIHNIDNNGPIGKKDLVVVDVGAEVENYSADITRTYAPSGKPTKRQQDVYNAVLAVQEYALSLIKPGNLIKENELKIEHFMGEKLRELGLIKSISREAVRRYYPHATSHYLGLDVHDVGDYSQPLAAGMVLTVEPGIYIPKESMGVRIEDDVLVTADGFQILTSALPRKLC